MTDENVVKVLPLELSERSSPAVAWKVDSAFCPHRSMVTSAGGPVVVSSGTTVGFDSVSVSLPVPIRALLRVWAGGGSGGFLLV
ncbi:hypothetical protein [Streptomyces sp. NPDC088170]|uniref:hypothetical protein n=1 Tax=Streptomyces sp. NPDC088170 TaxID=3365834 RepID=UPI00381F1B4E